MVHAGAWRLGRRFMPGRRAALLALALAGLPWPGAGGRALSLEVPFTSREYKQGLDVAALGPQAMSGAPALVERLRGLLARGGEGRGLAGLSFGPPRWRAVRFFDTADCRLRRASLLLRLRGEGAEGEVTLKARSPDLFRIAGMPLRARKEGREGWQDDFHLARQGEALVPVSDYALSVTVPGPVPVRLGALRDRIAHLEEGWPDGGGGQGGWDAELRPGPAIAELSIRSPHLEIAGRKTRLELSLWYGREDGRLLAGDLSFTLDLPLGPGEAGRAMAALAGLRTALGEAAGAEAEKSLRALPGRCGEG
ncbi:hypothetical protein MVG78_08215 [Roseomonas gilardii subsp. gilardii]|uniref:hypothetical protein n=1 Tax=Roseomonas gilardii TaxID=257708 RepID=UPI001FF77984|nr:hypothetical protein [Roseomonas gilardii]UPG74094.1 hypothetical protein MVG78_08215 [Roseomonas gilardii subsp. gilardii]